MPTYTYKCTKCQKVFDKIRKISERLRCQCPDCGYDSYQQVTAPRNVHGGFYDNLTRPKSA